MEVKLGKREEEDLRKHLQKLVEGMNEDGRIDKANIVIEEIIDRVEKIGKSAFIKGLDRIYD